MKFKVGDTVRVIGDPQSHRDKKEYYGKIGVIEYEYTNHSYPYVIKGFDPWKWRDVELELVEQPKIVITTDNVKVVTAKMYVDGKVAKTAEAKCAPEDKFDFTVGAKLACDRLTKKEAPKPKYYNGKVICIDNHGNKGTYTVGKVYEFIDGRMTTDTGTKMPGYFNEPITSFEHWVKWTASKFIPFVEG